MSQDQYDTQRGQAQKQYDAVLTITNQLLPSAVRLTRADTKRVYFEGPGNSSVELLDLSDGYRSFLSFVLDLLRQIFDAFDDATRYIDKDTQVFLRIPIDGVVLSDEAEMRSWVKEWLRPPSWVGLRWE